MCSLELVSSSAGHPHLKSGREQSSFAVYLRGLIPRLTQVLFPDLWATISGRSRKASSFALSLPQKLWEPRSTASLPDPGRSRRGESPKLFESPALGSRARGARVGDYSFQSALRRRAEPGSTRSQLGGLRVLPESCRWSRAVGGRGAKSPERVPGLRERGRQ